MKTKKQKLLDELADLEWRLDPSNPEPDEDVWWVISQKRRVQDMIEELESEKPS